MEKKVKVRFLEDVRIGDESYKKGQTVEMDEKLAKDVTRRFTGFYKVGGWMPNEVAQRNYHQKAEIVA